MKRLTLLFILGLMGPACTTTAQWNQQLDNYREGRAEPQRTREPDLRTEEEKMSASVGQAAAQVGAEMLICTALILLGAAAG